jgi:hypothetical protein
LKNTNFYLEDQIVKWTMKNILNDFTPKSHLSHSLKKFIRIELSL